MAAVRSLRQPITGGSPAVIAAINSLLQSINPQNPRVHQNPSPSTLDQFASFLRPNFVIEIIKDQTNPYHALFFFTWASNPSPNPNHYSHSHFCYIAITDKLLSHRLFSLAAGLLKSHDRFSDFMVGKFIKAHGDLGHLKWAVKHFREVNCGDFGGCRFSFNALLGVLVKANRIGHGLGYFAQIVVKTAAVRPDVSSYTTMIRGLCRAGMVVDAEKVFDEMTDCKNLVTFNVMIDGLCKNGLVAKAQRIVDQMVESNSDSGTGCLPDVMSYTTLLDGYCKKGELKNAMRCFDEMTSRGICEPNVLTYNVLINGLCVSGAVDEARRMVSRMQLNGVRADVATQTILLKGYSIAGRSDDAIEHFKSLVDKGMNLDEKAYTVAVNEYCNLGRPDRAIALIKEMITARGVRPKTATFNAVLRSFVKLHQFDDAILLMKQMQQWGFCPNFLSYNDVIIALVAARRMMQDAEMLVQEMVENGHRLDLTLYSSLIEGYCANGDAEKAVRLFKKMIDEKLIVGKRSLEVFIKEMASKGLMKCSCPT
ncbi:pentatricopeptide repeat-containing protein At5g65560-like [Andrographis paniculata]|uniref:pentatricopeptide repeat-containing protein At5g65560-like n=1 Tax=Andrographis paniculata TaxID=175694 RepID=UPI0021E92D99|nr:pentatricopeptide repeat-containing protein At5g65560-like [Andrographis paniculata]